MATTTSPSPKLDYYLVVHIATTCDEHGVYVTKDSAEVIELGWCLLDTQKCEDVSNNHCASEVNLSTNLSSSNRFITTIFW